jgi:HD-like signal output (HDOD) protein
MPEKDLKYQVQNILNLPSFPPVTMEIIQIIDDPDLNIYDLSKIINKDQALASKILKVANSPFYSYPRIISTIDFALTVLGLETVKEILISASIVGHLNKYHHHEFDLEKFWSHSIVSSLIARELAKTTNYKIVGEAFLAGLVHDIGIFIMAQFFPNDYAKVTEKIKDNPGDLLIYEKEEYTATHSEIGGWLFERWNFPIQLVESVTFHHTPNTLIQNPHLNSILYYTEYIVKERGMMSFEYESKINYSMDFLHDLSFEDISGLDLFYEKNKERFQREFSMISSII